MFNFSANHMKLLKVLFYNKYNIYIMKDLDTNRAYKLYDYSCNKSLKTDEIYCVSGKINSADSLYLVLEKIKIDKQLIDQISSCQ